MFVLSVLKDTIRIAPADLDVPIETAVQEQIHVKYANKVVVDVGLCLFLHSIDKMDDPVVYPVDGGAHLHVQFKMVVWRPRIGQAITGKVAQCTQFGLSISVEFSHDVFVSLSQLPQGSKLSACSIIFIQSSL